MVVKDISGAHRIKVCELINLEIRSNINRILQKWISD
jgi:hypothetical protein